MNFVCSRKVQYLVGSDGLMVKLPPAWCREHGVLKGSTVDLHVLDSGVLCIQKKEEKNER